MVGTPSVGPVVGGGATVDVGTAVGRVVVVVEALGVEALGVEGAVAVPGRTVAAGPWLSGAVVAELGLEVPGAPLDAAGRVVVTALAPLAGAVVAGDG